MLSDRHYSKTLEAKLLPVVQAGDTEGLVQLLKSFSRSEQRTAGYMLGERLLLDCPAELYWKMTEALVQYDSKAYLITLMKTLLARRKNSPHQTLRASVANAPQLLRYQRAIAPRGGFLSLALGEDGGVASFSRLAASFNEVERQKVALLLLPELGRPKEVEQLFSVLGIPKGREQMVYLVRIDTLPCLFLLLRSLHYIEHDREEVLKVARQLMKRGTGGSFNLASIIKVAFGLDELTGTFSLRLQPYQIARLEQSYEAFCQSVG